MITIIVVGVIVAILFFVLGISVRNTDEADALKEDIKRYQSNDINMKDRIAQMERDYLGKQHNTKLETDGIMASHRREIDEKNFEMKHAKDELVLKQQIELNDKIKTIAVLEQKITMLDKIVDLNADVVDVKDLVTKLISKLPEINIKDLSLSNNQVSNSR